MRLASGRISGQEALLVVKDAQGNEAWPVRELAAQYGPGPEEWTMADYVQRVDVRAAVTSWAARAEKEGLPAVAGWESLAPVAQPEKIICVGLNYRSHAQESQMAIPSSPVLFPKFPASLVGTRTEVKIPRDAGQIDYEAELVIVIGQECRDVSEEHALDYVLGYANGNDLSSRSLQFRTSQWLLGKVLDGFAPVGPYLVTADAVPNPDALWIRGWRNGELVQDSNTSQMIFSCRYLISYLSRYMTLRPGDVIFTGTPEGVILGMPEAERRWMTSGEQFTVAIEGLGELVTKIG